MTATTEAAVVQLAKLLIRGVADCNAEIGREVRPVPSPDEARVAAERILTAPPRLHPTFEYVSPPWRRGTSRKAHAYVRTHLTNEARAGRLGTQPTPQHVAELEDIAAPYVNAGVDPLERMMDRRGTDLQAFLMVSLDINRPLGAPQPVIATARPMFRRVPVQRPRGRRPRRRGTSQRGSPSDDTSEPPLAPPNLAVAARRRRMPSLTRVGQFVVVPQRKEP